MDSNAVSKVSPKYSTDDKLYVSKIHNHSLSLKAMKTYNDMPIERTFENIDSSTITSFDSIRPISRECDENSFARDSLESDTKSTTNSGDYATIGTFSMSGSDINAVDFNEMGSTLKLMAPKVQKSWQTWSPYITTTMCSTCIAAGFGNFYRLPQTAMIRGGLPFLIVYMGLSVCIGLPIVFLEIGIGQLAQGGVIKSWRAVPFFKGIGYVKLFMCCLLIIYYPLYIGVSLFYVIWIVKASLPFQECFNGVKMTDNGYVSNGKDGQSCLKSTFLKNPHEDPTWYGIYASLLVITWIVITIMSAWKTRSYIRSLLVLLIPMLAGYLFLFCKALMLQKDNSHLHTFFSEADWSLLSSASIWYFAAVQIFFSTNVGFGTLVTNAGIIYNKVNPFWTALIYIIINMLFGIGSVITSVSLPNYIKNSTNTPKIELHLLATIYEVGSSSENEDFKVWTLFFYCITMISGFISTVTLVYTLLKAVTIQSKNRWKWWHITLLVNFISFFLGCMALLSPDFNIVHLLDHYIVGNMVVIVTVIEILALISCYGIDRIKTDFEFIMGHTLSSIWLLLWWLIPLFLTAIFGWAMITLPFEGINQKDPSWIYGIGWGVVLTTTFLIFVFGYYIVTKQDGYTFRDKLKASMKPTKNWGPKDPISRLNWMHWNSKAQQGEKDFTLKRKGTRDYTRSVKKRKALQNQAPSQISANSIQGLYKQSNKTNISESNIYAEVPEQITANQRIYDFMDEKDPVTSLPKEKAEIDLFELNKYNNFNYNINSPPKNFHLQSSVNKSLNPLAQVDTKNNFDDIGSLRKGPYIISDNTIDHICYRKYGDNVDVSEL